MLFSAFQSLSPKVPPESFSNSPQILPVQSLHNKTHQLSNERTQGAHYQSSTFLWFSQRPCETKFTMNSNRKLIMTWRPSRLCESPWHQGCPLNCWVSTQALCGRANCSCWRLGRSEGGGWALEAGGWRLESWKLEAGGSRRFEAAWKLEESLLEARDWSAPRAARGKNINQYQ